MQSSCPQLDPIYHCKTAGQLRDFLIFCEPRQAYCSLVFVNDQWHGMQLDRTLLVDVVSLHRCHLVNKYCQKIQFDRFIEQVCRSAITLILSRCVSFLKAWYVPADRTVRSRLSAYTSIPCWSEYKRSTPHGSQSPSSMSRHSLHQTLFRARNDRKVRH